MTATPLMMQAEAERAALNKVVRRLMKEKGLTQVDIDREVFGRPISRGMRFEDNFRKGKMARAHAARVYEWLRQQHELYADEVDTAISRIYANRGEDGPWDIFVRRHGQFGRVKIQELEFEAQTQQQLQRMSRAEWEDRLRVEASIALNAPLEFVFASPVTGVVVGVQWMRGQWYGLPLGTETAGIQLDAARRFPKLGVPLEDEIICEPSETGLHRLAFLILPTETGRNIAARLPLSQALGSDLLAGIAEQVEALPPDTNWLMARLNVMFVVARH